MTRLLPLAALLAAAPALAAAQSSTGDADLFPEDERVLRFGTDERHVTLAPFVQYDFGTVRSDLEDREDEGGTLRLARLYVFGRAGDLSGTYAQNLDDDDFPIAYAFGAYDPSERWTIRAGQQDEPFSLQDMSGSRFLPFAEAGLVAAISPGDNVGLAALRSGDRSSLALGVFGGDLNTGVGDEGVALTGRATWAPVYEEERIKRGGGRHRLGHGHTAGGPPPPPRDRRLGALRRGRARELLGRGRLGAGGRSARHLAVAARRGLAPARQPRDGRHARRGLGPGRGRGRLGGIRGRRRRRPGGLPLRDVVPHGRATGLRSLGGHLRPSGPEARDRRRGPPAPTSSAAGWDGST